MAPRPAYHVDWPSIRPDTGLDQTSFMPVDIHHVTYIIDSGDQEGHKRTVTVPDRSFTADGVRAAVEADLDNFLAIANLKG